MRLFSVLPIKFYCVERQKILLFFNLSGKKTVKVGLLAQAPQGNGGNRIYEDLHIEKKTVKNIRFGE